MGDHDLIELLSAAGLHLVVVTVAPSAGGRIAQLEIDGRPMLIGDGPDPTGWGLFPMAPWAGRVRAGRFEFDGVQYQLDQNQAPHAIHGTTFDRPWRVVEHDPTSVTMAIDLDWPFGGTAAQVVTLTPDALVLRLAVHALDTAMPAEIGWHPWFVKPDSVSFAPFGRYVRDAQGIALDEVVRLDPPGDLTGGPFDDCFLNTAPTVIHSAHLSLTLTADCDHWVLFDEPADATCLEPQSGPPDAFNIRPRRLAKGEALVRSFTIAWNGQH